MKFLFVYRGGDVPADQVDRNIDDLWRWLDDLKDKGYETVRFAGSGRKTVTPNGVDEHSGDLFGISIIEAGSLEEAVSLTANWPELQHGGKIEILQAL